MQVSASQELELMAAKFANEAVQFDRQGVRSNAISRYERTTEILLKLCSLYPEAPQNKLYMQQVENCKRRVKELKNGDVPLDERDSSQAKIQPKLEQLILTEKPDVKWSEIANLHDAKKAIEESIVFPLRRRTSFHSVGQEEFYSSDHRVAARHYLPQR